MFNTQDRPLDFNFHRYDQVLVCTIFVFNTRYSLYKNEPQKSVQNQEHLCLSKNLLVIKEKSVWMLSSRRTAPLTVSLWDCDWFATVGALFPMWWEISEGGGCLGGGGEGGANKAWSVWVGWVDLKNNNKNISSILHCTFGGGSCYIRRKTTEEWWPNG